jgi:hypothetical protein
MTPTKSWNYNENDFSRSHDEWQHQGNSLVSNNIHELSLFNFEIPSLKKGKPIPKLGDIWILGLTNTKQHYVRLYMLGMEDMFRSKDMIIKVNILGQYPKF